MKKLSAFAILFTGMFSTAYGQEIKASPAFDNIHNDREIMKSVSPPTNRIYALIDVQNSTEVYYQKPVLPIQKIEVIDIKAHKTNVYPGSGDLFTKLPHYPLTSPYDHFIPAKITY